MKQIFSRFILCILLFINGTQLFSQTDSVTYYFDAEGGISNLTNATYIAKGIRQKDRLQLSFTMLKTGNLIMEATYMDSTLAIKSGHFALYKEDGTGIIKKGNYLNNAEDGTWLIWDINNKLSDSIVYENGVDIIHNEFFYDRSGKLVKRTSIDNRTGNSEDFNFDEKGNKESYTKRVKATAEHIYYYPNGNIRSTDKMEAGKLVSVKYYGPDGREISEKEGKKYEKESKKAAADIAVSNSDRPIYPGGEVAFYDFLKRNMQLSPSDLGNVGSRSTMYISFMLDKKGNPKDIKVDGVSRDTQLNVASVINRMPSWNMHGLPGYGPMKFSLDISTIY
jgi:antitoxin component YwqK of YwqJK toxin-antitoxin module